MLWEVLVNNSTPSCQVENIIQFPIIVDKNQKSRVDEIVIENNNISRDDWDSFEVSWDFKMHPLILSAKDKEDALTTQFAKSRMEKLGLISWHYDRWTENCQARFDTLRRNEEELNRIFIGIYGLQQELTPEVDTGKLMNKNLTSQSRRHITIIEDDKALNDGIVLALKNTEFTFTQNYSLGEFCAGDPTDLIILDVNLPDGSGFDFLREYREVSDTPVIILTAKDLETDEVTGLTLGADDYITKPFSLMVLRARIDKVLQKRQMFSGNSYSDDEYSFDFDMKSSRVMVDRISDLPASLRMGLYKSIKMLSKEFISFSVEHL